MKLNTELKTLEGEFAEYLPGLFNLAMAMPHDEMWRYLKDTDRAVPGLSESKAETLTSTDPMAAWFNNCCLQADGVKTPVGKLSKTRVSEISNGHSESRDKIDDIDECLYPSYVNYCIESNHKYQSIQHFSEKLTNLCVNTVGLPNVEKKRDAKGVCIIGITLRRGNTTHPRPITGDLDPQSPPTPEDVWASIPPDEQVSVQSIVDAAWDIPKFKDDDVRDLTQAWMSRHSRSVRLHSVRYLKSSPEKGSAIVERINKFAPEFANVA